MKLLLSFRRLWMAMGLRGRLVAGYSALFAVLLLGIAISETTVVRQVLIDDRKAALPSTTNNLVSFLTQPTSATGAGVTVSGALPVVTGNNDIVVALLSADGAVLSREAGSAVQSVDPKQLLESANATGDTTAATTYERTIAGNTYLVQVRTIPTLTQVSGTQMSVMTAAPSGAISISGQVHAEGADGATVPASGTISIQGQAPITGIRAPASGTISIQGQAPAGTAGTVAVTMLVAESLRSVDDTVNTLLLITLTASTLGLLLAAAVGLAVAGRALRPLERMTATAQAIAAGGDGALDRRLGLPAHGDEVGRLATTFDRMLDRIQDTIAERVRSETRLRHFAADASHELRTPLAAVSGYTEVLLLGGKDDPETATHVLRRMDGELARMNRLVGDLLTLARLEAGLPMHIQALPVAPLLEGLIEETRLLAMRSARDLVIEADPQNGEADTLAVLADSDRLHQILLNLLHNAVKFTPDGGRVTLSAAGRNGKIALSVSDTGPGIAAAERPFLFERFYRSDQARARGADADAGGAGLGLAIAQGLAQTQGGHIEVAGSPGSGSIFTVILPAAPTDG